MFDFKNERFIVNGSHDASKLQQLLDGFIKRFVLCPECSNPETQLTASQKKQTISQRCIACGYTGMIDMRHKLTTFILKILLIRILLLHLLSRPRKTRRIRRQ